MNATVRSRSSAALFALLLLGGTAACESEPDAEPEDDVQVAALSDDAIKAQRHLIVDRVQKLICTEVNAITTRGCKAKNTIDWIARFYDKHLEQMEKAIEPVISAYKALPGVECHVSAGSVAKCHVADSKSQLAEVLGYAADSDDLASHIADATQEWYARADAVADHIMGV